MPHVPGKAGRRPYTDRRLNAPQIKTIRQLGRQAARNTAYAIDKKKRRFPAAFLFLGDTCGQVECIIIRFLQKPAYFQVRLYVPVANPSRTL